MFVDRTTRSVEGGTPRVEQTRENRDAASVRLTLSVGRHSIVSGVELEDASVSTRLHLHHINRQAEQTYDEYVSSSRGTVHNRVPTLFLQDAWRLTRRLTVSGGVRWSEQRFSRASGGTAQRMSDEWQPRLGFSWYLDDRYQQRLFGSAGRFYQMVPLNAAALWYVDFSAFIHTYDIDPRTAGATPVQTIDNTSTADQFAHHVVGAHAEHFDEATIGYERVVGSGTTVRARAIRRELRSSFGWGIDLDRRPIYVLGTHGEGELSFLPRARREYTALELSADGTWRDLSYRTSYVLSRTHGNYSGLHYSDLGFANPGGNGALFMEHQRTNTTGPLPNDRRHVLKVAGGVPVTPNLVLGGVFTWQSGTPINEFGASPLGALQPAFLVPRGSAGRTPSTYDLDLRLTYAIRKLAGGSSRLVLDLMQIGNPREVVRVDEVRFSRLEPTGEQGNENPSYRRPIAFQPPMMARLGVEVRF